MGDRTYCTTTINKHYYNQLEQEFGGEQKLEEKTQVCEIRKEDDLVEFHDDQANYGQMEELENILQERKIEYNRRWEAGSEYGAGEEYARKVNGEYKIHDLYDDGASVLTELKTVLAETDPIKREALLNY